MQGYLIVMEPTATCCSAYASEFVATAASRAVVERVTLEATALATGPMRTVGRSPRAGQSRVRSTRLPDQRENFTELMVP